MSPCAKLSFRAKPRNLSRSYTILVIPDLPPVIPDPDRGPRRRAAPTSQTPDPSALLTVTGRDLSPAPSHSEPSNMSPEPSHMSPIHVTLGPPKCHSERSRRIYAPLTETPTPHPPSSLPVTPHHYPHPRGISSTYPPRARPSTPTRNPMPPTNKNLTTAVENYFADLQRIRASGGSTPELSYYPPLTNLLNAVGSTLKPKVFCISAMAQQGADHPDFGLYAAKQLQKGKPRQGQLPERGAIEVKSATDDAWLTADGGQVSKYWGLYRIVLVTNTRDFVLLGENAAGLPAKAGDLQARRQRRGVRPTTTEAPRLRPRRRGRSGRVPLPRPLPHRLA